MLLLGGCELPSTSVLLCGLCDVVLEAVESLWPGYASDGSGKLGWAHIEGPNGVDYKAKKYLLNEWTKERE